ncbi:1-acyl-sn-glycerol-3-phosphate acyltransferase [Nitzschia inconspicua]|uniref:1-acyl-sn-glycerol-3-phosphate acyltransferase n=1 Tax=Nitzschia inconspicua TaxID=303405 RepID=A0A9K3KJ24_9STRA|nr:1-acyl-sn-glycerol-3-phosphate acyltransferase [Nitzschia inconspicua]
MFYFLLSIFWTIFLIVEVIICIGAFTAVLQERKIWINPKLPSLKPVPGMLKVYLLNVFWMSCCLIGAILTVIEAVITLDWKFQNTRQFAHNQVERRVAQWATKLFIGPVEIRGLENLPSADPGAPAPIYIANHDSQIDLAAVYYLNRPWRWISKSQVMFLPGVGQVMYLSDHVFIDRVKKKNKSKDSSTGARNLYLKSNESVQSGVPMFFFPQGTRRLGERLPFKDGAFKVAQENDSVLIPISIEIPLTAWNSMYPLTKATSPVVLTIHKPIPTKGRDTESLKKESFDVIYSVLPDYTKQS